MKTRFYTGLIVFAILLLALGRLIVRPPMPRLRTRKREGDIDPRPVHG
jgi:hypothetical protein